MSTRTPGDWSRKDDDYLAQFPELDDELVGILVVHFSRVPSDIRRRHPQVLNRKRLAVRMTRQHNESLQEAPASP